MYSSIALAACFPAPIARITVAAPVTASPPAYTPNPLIKHTTEGLETNAHGCIVTKDESGLDKE